MGYLGPRCSQLGPIEPFAHHLTQTPTSLGMTGIFIIIELEPDVSWGSPSSRWSVNPPQPTGHSWIHRPSTELQKRPQIHRFMILATFVSGIKCLDHSWLVSQPPSTHSDILMASSSRRRLHRGPLVKASSGLKREPRQKHPSSYHSTAMLGALGYVGGHSLSGELHRPLPSHRHSRFMSHGEAIFPTSLELGRNSAAGKRTCSHFIHPRGLGKPWKM